MWVVLFVGLLHCHTSPRRAISYGRPRSLSGKALMASSATLEPVTVVEPVGGLPAEVVRLGAAGDATYHIVYVPGNPGLPAYYTSTCTKLCRRLNATAAIIGLRGHSEAPLLPPRLAFGLSTQVEHVASFMRSEIAALPPSDTPRLLVLGHSIGAYIAFKAAMRSSPRPAEHVRCAVGLMPYLDNTGIEGNKKLRSQAWRAIARVSLIRSPTAPILIWLVACVAQLLGALLPNRVKRYLLSSATAKFEPAAKHLTESAALSFRFVNNMLQLFRSEAQNHQTPFDFSELKATLGSDRIGLLYVDGSTDHWAAAAAAERARSSGVAVRFLDAATPHAFSTTTATDNYVAQSAGVWCAEMLAK
ncbi:hypothetical protein AB1Y20_023297 [Prymnesium parvum]|uniref:Lipid droplet-associated hydrolase n=1 Tax=Prymnesium parvum TaxID=97485 RepID=A0AB34JFY7_PRYPA